MTTLKLFGYRYNVVDDIDVNNRGLLGICESDKHTISMSVEMSKQQRFSVLIHEIVEAILDHLGIELEHQWVMIIETVAFQVLVDNWGVLAQHMVALEEDRKLESLPVVTRTLQ